MAVNRQYILRSRPLGQLADSDLELREQPIRAPDPGEVQIATKLISIDPTIRIWMSDIPQYLPPIELGDVVRALGIAEVEQSSHPDFAVGELVAAGVGWQTHSTGKPEELMINKLAPGLSPELGISILSMTSGFTAYFGLLDVLDPQPGETVVVTAAAGAVGSLVGQIAKLKGCRVIGIAGGPEKCRYVTEELGFDACIDHRSEDVGAGLDRLCPEGIDVDFENVGGPIFDAILLRMKLHGRICLCGLIADYDQLGQPVAGPYNFGQILMKRLHVHGFIILDYIPRFAEAVPDLVGWMSSGKLKQRIYEKQGFTSLPDALRELVGGRSEKIGKMIVRL
ncbi:MAG: NADP-dependent oxidoreductase [Deltaproteobacteria bacterium]|nr:NADP-dependent oxidoreductase [Deltaproteobacteria bacterium]